MRRRPPEPARRLFTTGQVARRFNVSRVAVKNWIRTGKILGQRTPGGHFRIPAEQLDRFDLPEPGSLRVLVIDDDDALAALVVDGFRELWPEAKVETATDGYEGLIQLGAFRPDVALIDLRMPALDALEMCRRVKTNPATRSTRIVVISGYPTPPAGQRALDAGADLFVPKPFAVRALVAHIGALVGTAIPSP